MLNLDRSRGKGVLMADLSTLDDRVLWTRATQTHCEDAFRTLMKRHEHLVWSVCLRLLARTNDAEDALQMAFIALLEHGDEINSSDFRPWLYRVAYRAALRVQSGRPGVDALADAGSVPEVAVDAEVFRSIERSEESQLIDAALDSLPEKYREVLVLHYCYGVARSDIASQLGLTPQTVKARLSRARKALRSRLMRRGLSLSVAAVLLGSSAEAAVPPTLQDSTWQLAQRWLTGEPVGLDLAQFSDFPQTEYGMKALSGLNAKWTLVGAAAALVALFVVYEVGRASASPSHQGVSNGTGSRLPADATRLAFHEETTDAATTVSYSANNPAATRLAVQEQTPERAARPHSVVDPPERPQPEPPRYPTETPNTRAISASQMRQPARGLSNGTWKRDSMVGTMSFLVDDNRLQVDFHGKGELAMIRASLLGEYSVASVGTVFGLFHGVDIDLPAGGGAGDIEELGPLSGMLSDSPFSMRVHTTGDAMVIKKFTLGVGVPMDDGMKEYATMGAMASVYVTGTYRLNQQPQRVGQLPPRVSYRSVPPSAFRPLQYPNPGSYAPGNTGQQPPAVSLPASYPPVQPSTNPQYWPPNASPVAPSGFQPVPPLNQPVTPPAQPSATPSA